MTIARYASPRRIAEKTGCDLRHLSDVIDPLIAIRLTEGFRR